MAVPSTSTAWKTISGVDKDLVTKIYNNGISDTSKFTSEAKDLWVEYDKYFAKLSDNGKYGQDNGPVVVYPGAFTGYTNTPLVSNATQASFQFNVVNPYCLTSSTINTSISSIPIRPIPSSSLTNISNSLSDIGFELEAPRGLPLITIPSPPTIDYGSIPQKTFSFTSPTLPDEPNVELPELPTLTGITIPTAPVVDMPAFSACIPADMIDPPTHRFVWQEDEYYPEELKALRVKLQNDMDLGGYGIEVNDEIGIWRRAAERESIASEQAQSEMLSEFARRGFVRPTGVMFSELEKIQMRTHATMVSASREVSLKRADLYQQNRQFTIEQCRQCEQIFINMHNVYMERQLNAAKEIGSYAIELFNAQITKYNSNLETYKAYASVYESRIKAAVNVMETYRIQIEGERAKGEVDKLKFEAYQTAVEAIRSNVEIYKTKMDGARLFVEVEKAKIEAYQSDIEAYTAGLKAQEAKVSIYEAQIRGENIKLGIESEKVKIEMMEVEKAKAKAEVYKSKHDAAVEALREQIAYNRLQMDSDELKMRLDVEKAKINIQNERNRMDSHYENEKIKVALVETNADNYLKNIQGQDIQKERERTVKFLDRLASFKAESETMMRAYEFMLPYYRDMIKNSISAAQAIIIKNE
jgi:hypothetical protein